MHGFATYETLKARQALVAKRAEAASRHGDALRRREHGWWPRLVLSVLSVLPAPAARPVCCAA
jgi:hypothetical protein